MKKTIIVFLFAILVGIAFSYYLFRGIDKTLAKTFDTYQGIIYQVGVFKVYENALKESHKYSSSIIVKDNDIYRVYIAIAVDNEVQIAYENFFKRKNIAFYKKRVVIDENCYQRINSFENLIKQSFNESTYFNINKELLSYYKVGCHD